MRWQDPYSGRQHSSPGRDPHDRLGPKTQSSWPGYTGRCARGYSARLQRLIAGGAPLDPVDSAKQTPLLLAVQSNHLAAAKLLIEAGANINAQAANMDTPWLLAGARGRTEMLRLMIPKGPDYALRNRYGGTALIPACHYGHVERYACC